MDYGEAVTEFEEFFSVEYEQEVLEAERQGDDSVVVEFEQLDLFKPELTDYIKENPEQALEAASEGVMAVDLLEEELNVRIEGMPEEDYILLKNLRSKHIGKFVPVEGMIKRASQVKPEVIAAVFECTQCGATYEKEQDSSQLKSPYKCECGSKRFEPIDKIMTDTQIVTLEENPESREGSEQPSSLSVRLEGDLVDPEFQRKVIPGNVVEVTGIVRERPIKKNSKKFDIYMEANNVKPTQQEFEQLELSQEEIDEIKQMGEDPDIFERIVESIAPSIFGHEKVKQAIALQLFGGVKKTREDGVKSRGDLHILLIGEPGTGKSQLLKFAGELSPKGRYVVGKSSSGAGLTASVVKEESTGEFSLEAGAVVLAHKGMAAIDEIDKMSQEDRSSLHEAMEQQCFAPETEVAMADGSRKTISEIVGPIVDKGENISSKENKEVVRPEENVEILGTGIDDFETKKVEASALGRRAAPDEMIRTDLSTGRKIELTPDHPVYRVEDGEIVEVEASEISEDSFIISPREMPIEGEEQSLSDIEVEEGRKDVETPEHNSPALAKFTGYQVSDGGYEMNRGEKNGFNFTNSNKELVEDYVEVIDDLFGVEPYIRDREGRDEVRIISMELKNWLEELGPIVDSGKTKKIPERLMKCRKDDIKYLLKAFFDGDGGVYRVQRGYRIRAVVENKELIKQVQDLLLRFGIHSTIRKDQNVWRIDITRYSDLKKFNDHIGFLSADKQARLEEALKTRRDSKEAIPGISETLMRLMQETGIDQSQLLDSNLYSGQNVSRRTALKVLEKVKKQINRAEKTEPAETVEGLKKQREIFDLSMRQVAEKIDVDPSLIGYWEKNGTSRLEEYREGLEGCLEEIIELKSEALRIEHIAENLRFLRVKNVERFEPKYEYVYDLTVPETENFIAENTVAHNSITVNKANIQATLNAQTSILAAGNPKLGRFDPYEPIPEQISIGDTLLSRFDFIFPVKDEPDQDRDSKLATQILDNHIEPEDQDAEISQEKLRKYVAYAKRSVRPDLRQDAAQEIQEFYVSMRSKGQSDSGSVPITARQLEALVRIAEASARAQLKEEVEVEDAKRAIDILTYCLKQVGVDPETGDFDIDMIESGVSSSQRSRLQMIKQLIDQLAGDDDSAEIEAVLEAAEEEGVEEEKAEEIIEKLKREGELFEPQQGFIQKI